MCFLPSTGISARIFAKWLELPTLNEINDLIETGFVQTTKRRTISLHPMIQEITLSETKPSVSNCHTLLDIRNCIVINNFNAKLHPQYPWVQFCINQYSNVSPSMISQPKSRKSLVFLTILLLPVKIRKPVFISVKHLSVLVRCSEHPEDVTIPFHRVHSVGHHYDSAL